jgi:hypothetical protein
MQKGRASGPSFNQVQIVELMSIGNARTADMLQRLWPQVTTRPDLHFHSLDAKRQAGLFVHMPEGAYRSASFLDGRTFDAQTVGGWIPLERIKTTVLNGPRAAGRLHFIFHMGHTGSTLLSRLLDETGVVQPLREPLVLREWAGFHDKRGDAASLMSPDDIDACLEIMLRLWARCPEASQSAIVKATSTAARVGGPLMAARATANAVYLSMAPEPYMAAILMPSEPRIDIRHHAEERMRRLIGHLGAAPKPLYAMSRGELIAASWLTEALTRESLKEAVRERLLLLDFDEMLADLPATLQRVLSHLHLPDDPETVDRIAHCGILGRYSKAPEHAYSKELRQQAIEQSRQQHRAVIAEGMNFLTDIATRHPQLQTIL